MQTVSTVAAHRPPSLTRMGLLRTVGFAWWLPLLIAAVAGATAYLISLDQKEVFQAQALVLAPISTSADPAADLSAYAALPTDTTVLRNTIRDLRLPATEEQLAAAVETERVDTLITVRVNAATALGARSVAEALLQNMIARSLTQFPEAPLTVLSAPAVPRDPLETNAARNTGMAVALGLAGGVALAALLARRERPIATHLDVEAITGWAVLELIPHEPDSGTPALLERPYDADACAYERLHERLTSLYATAPFRTLLVTSVERGDGATLTALNLALATAALGNTALLIDADLRHPILHRLLKLPNDHGLAEALRGEAVSALAPLAQTHGTLWVVPSGVLPADPSVLFQCARASAVFQQLATAADLVIIDGPAAAADAETGFLASLCDATLIVANARRTDSASMETAAAKLSESGARVLGVCLTRAPEAATVAVWESTASD